MEQAQKPIHLLWSLTSCDGSATWWMPNVHLKKYNCFNIMARFDTVRLHTVRLHKRNNRKLECPQWWVVKDSPNCRMQRIADLMPWHKPAHNLSHQKSYASCRTFQVKQFLAQTMQENFLLLSLRHLKKKENILGNGGKYNSLQQHTTGRHCGFRSGTP